MKRLIYLLGVVLLAAVSCNKEVAAPIENASANLSPMRFTAFADSDLSKTYLSEDFSIKWTMSDAITVFAGENAPGARFTVESVEDGGASATFTGLADVSPVYYALSPDQVEEASISGGVITARIPANQWDPDPGSYGINANLAVAKAESDVLQFKNVGAIVGIKITEPDLDNIVLRSLNQEDRLTGLGQISYNDGEPVFAVSDGCEWACISGEFTVGETYYFVVLPGNFASGFALDFVKGGYMATMENTKPANIARNGNYFLGEINIPAEKWEPFVTFTPGDKVCIKGLSEAENGQEMTYMSSGYYSASAGDDAAFPETYNYEVWARLEPGQGIYLEDENGIRYGISADGATVAPVGPGETGAFSPASNSIYRIRVNLPSGDASVARIGGVEASLLYTPGWSNSWFNPADYYVGKGQFSFPRITINWGVQEWDAHMVRYRLKFWFNRKGNTDINVWHQYGAVNAASGAPTTDDPSNSYYFLQPFAAEDWGEIFYFGDWLYDVNNNGRYTATLNLYMNSTYGHFTHGFSDVEDTMAAPFVLNGAGAEVQGQRLLKISDGVYRVYAKLVGGEVSVTNGVDSYTFTVPATPDDADAIRATFNITTNEVTTEVINKVRVLYAGDFNDIVILTYQGEGVWQGTGGVWYRDMGGWYDERYYFIPTTDGEQRLCWGRKNGVDPENRPDGQQAADYYECEEFGWQQWEHCWKLPTAANNGASVTITLNTNDDGVMKHSVVVNQ